MRSNGRVDILLSFMPFGNPSFASLGLSLLKAGLKQRSVDTSVAYYNLAFTKAITLDRYLLLSAFGESFFGEWIFSQIAFGKGDLEDRRSHEKALLGLLERKRFRESDISPEDFREILLEVREKAEGFVDSCVDDIVSVNPKILGFSTMFSQNCSSLAVARRVKDRLGNNAPMIVFGGSNCEGIMGHTLLKAFPWIDYVCCGEGDDAFIKFAECVLRDERPRVQGIIGRDGNSLDQFSTPPPIKNMDELPFPDFEDYFLALRTFGLDGIMTPQLAIETSRGCWWGEISHCTFCGLNGLTMKYRAKTDERVLKELDYLLKKWGSLTIQVVDNILNLNFFKSFFRELIRRRMELNLLFETKSNLKREQLRLLKDAGVRHVQPGIESLSDNILNEMKKGVTGLQNVWLLKVCREMGISLSWNWLAGFPKEKPLEYERMSDLVPLLYHLQPPLGFGPIHLDRFSPNFNFPESFGIKNLRVANSYKLIYPLDDKTLYDLAYYFDFDYEDGRDPTSYTKGLGDEVLRWIRAWGTSGAAPILPVLRRPIAQKLARPFFRLLGAPVPAMLGAPVLAMLDFGIGVLIWDTRPCATRPLFVLRGLDANVFRYADDVRRYDVLVQHFTDLGHESAKIQRAVSNLLQKKVLILDSGRCLALVPKATISMILARLFSGFLRMLPKLMNLTQRRAADLR